MDLAAVAIAYLQFREGSHASRSLALARMGDDRGGAIWLISESCRVPSVADPSPKRGPPR